MMTSIPFSGISDSTLTMEAVAQTLSSSTSREWPTYREPHPFLRTWGGTVPWHIITWPCSEEKMSRQTVGVVPLEAETSYRPRTPLGRRLMELRMQAIQKGMKLLSEDEILQEVKRRRGELKDDDEENIH